MEPEVKVTEAVRNLLEDVVNRNGKLYSLGVYWNFY
jgi:hypothetical protein